MRAWARKDASSSAFLFAPLCPLLFALKCRAGTDRAGVAALLICMQLPLEIWLAVCTRKQTFRIPVYLVHIYEHRRIFSTCLD